MKILSYLRSVQSELKKVSWPTRQSTIKMSLIVVGASLAVGLYVSALDLTFTSLLSSLLQK